MQNIQDVLQQHEEMQVAMLAQLLVADYKRLVSNCAAAHWFDPEDIKRMKAYEVMFHYYLKSTEIADVGKWVESLINNDPEKYVLKTFS